MKQMFNFELSEQQLVNLNEFLNRVTVSGINEASAYIELLKLFGFIEINESVFNKETGEIGNK